MSGALNDAPTTATHDEVGSQARTRPETRDLPELRIACSEQADPSRSLRQISGTRAALGMGAGTGPPQRCRTPAAVDASTGPRNRRRGAKRAGTSCHARHDRAGNETAGRFGGAIRRHRDRAPPYQGESGPSDRAGPSAARRGMRGTPPDGPRPPRASERLTRRPFPRPPLRRPEPLARRRPHHPRR